MKRIFLIGYMGVGKTTIGRTLAKRLNLAFFDLDLYIEGRFRRKISEIFAEKGEAGFRETERNMLHEVAEFEDVLISTGGGAPCHFDNMAFMNSVGQTIYLKASPEELVRRLASGRQERPVLAGRQGGELLEFVRESLKKRDMYYNQADIVFDCEALKTSKDTRAVVRELIDII